VAFSAGDTSAEAAAVQLAAWRCLGPEARGAMAAQLSDDIRQVSLAGIRQRHPEYTDDEVRRALLRLVAMLDAAGMPHMLTGSFASAFHGTPRATQDIDFVIDATRVALDAASLEV
jgi:hypothetical protein